MLKVSDIVAGYGKHVVLRDLNLLVPEGGLVVVLGPNGAGKTTLVRTISGMAQLMQGDIRVRNVSIKRTAPFRIARLGVAHVPEGRRMLRGLTVLDSLRLGALVRRKQERKDAIDAVLTEFPLLLERRDQPAELLSGGEQQILAIARAIVSGPSLMLVDEPSLGLAPLMVRRVFDYLLKLNQEEGMSMLLVEQGWNATRLASYVYVLENGEIALEGTPEEISQLDQVSRAYLGGQLDEGPSR